MDLARNRITITGIVQGVGFRPFIYNLACSLSLKGWVINSGSSVIIEAESSEKDLESFASRIKTDSPPLSKIRDIQIEVLPLSGYTSFDIRKSSEGSTDNIYISPDISTCSDCRKELMDKSDRRYLYPFINCTNCGPRFTIIKDVPYDRHKTTMSSFIMCEKCSSEYSEPSDRRYHAQPVSCHSCGPVLKLLDNTGSEITVPDPLFHARKLISQGCILAVKGLGGYHLACDAYNDEAVKLLRTRKIRDDKPFAVMARDYETAARICHINAYEKYLLESPASPIVLLRKKSGLLSPHIADGNPYLGVMLPYTPVHLLLLAPLTDSASAASSGESPECSDVLVMTSGNKSGEPVYYKDDEAIEELKNVADYFLVNDRDIYIRTDDSVTRSFRNTEYIIRRSRGYVPLPVTCKIGTGNEASVKTSTPDGSAIGRSFCVSASDNIPSILACGGELKNTFCLNKGNDFYLSHHIGDLENAETYQSFEEGIEHFKRVLHIKPTAVAYDLHPSYMSTQFALSSGIYPSVAVQHHHAHIASCMAENSLQGEVIGLAFDGTGYGEDGHIWGGEFLTGSYEHFTRVGHLDYIALPGGDAAVRQPWRIALSYLYSIYGKSIYDSNLSHGIVIDGTKYLESIEASRIHAVLQMLEKGINSPLTSSMGRLFDAVSALMGIRHEITYEGQAAMELEFVADNRGMDEHGFELNNGCADGYSFELNDSGSSFTINTAKIIRGVLDDLNSGVSNHTISCKFHKAIANMAAECAYFIRSKYGLDKVVLSGGVFQNMLLLEKSVSALEKKGFKVYTHSRVPSNDGGIALGQAVIAAARLKKL